MARMIGPFDSKPVQGALVTEVTDFTSMFSETPYRPNFTKRAGTWNMFGSFVPTT